MPTVLFSSYGGWTAFDVSEFVVSAMQDACGAGVLEGLMESLELQINSTRAQVATMLMRFCTDMVK